MSVPVDLTQFDGMTPGPWVAKASGKRTQSGARRPSFPEGRWIILAASKAGDPNRMPLAEVDRANHHHAPTRASAEHDANAIAALPDLIAEVRELRAALREMIDVDDAHSVLSAIEYGQRLAKAKEVARAILAGGAP